MLSCYLCSLYYIKIGRLQYDGGDNSKLYLQGGPCADETEGT